MKNEISDDEREQRIKAHMAATNMPEHEARLAVAIELGEVSGDVLEESPSEKIKR